MRKDVNYYANRKEVFLLKIVRLTFFILFLSLAFVSIKLSIKTDERNYDWRNNSDGTVTIIHYNGPHLEFPFKPFKWQKVAKVSSGIFEKRDIYSFYRKFIS